MLFQKYDYHNNANGYVHLQIMQIAMPVINCWGELLMSHPCVNLAFATLTKDMRGTGLLSFIHHHHKSYFHKIVAPFTPPCLKTLFATDDQATPWKNWKNLHQLWTIVLPNCRQKRLLTTHVMMSK